MAQLRIFMLDTNEIGVLHTTTLCTNGMTFDWVEAGSRKEFSNAFRSRSGYGTNELIV